MRALSSSASGLVCYAAEGEAVLRWQVVDMLKEAMGNRSYGRGADPYCGGVDFEDEWCAFTCLSLSRTASLLSASLECLCRRV